MKKIVLIGDSIRMGYDKYVKAALEANPAVHSDNVHYNTDEGRRLLGGCVLTVLCKELGISAAVMQLENFIPKTIRQRRLDTDGRIGTVHATS